MVVNLGWTDNYLAIIVPSAITGFSIFLIRQYILSVSDELLDAARIDGASEMSIFWRVVVPLVRAGLGVVLFFLLQPPERLSVAAYCVE